MQSNDNHEDETNDDNCDNCWCLWQGIARHVKQWWWWWPWIYSKSGHYMFYLLHPWHYLMSDRQLLPSAPILKVDKTENQANDKSTYKNHKFKKYTPTLRCWLKLSTKNKMSLKSKMPNLNHDYNITLQFFLFL